MKLVSQFLSEYLLQRSVLENGRETITDVVTCCPVKMSATANQCAHSATTIGAANASGITNKHNAWRSLTDLPHKFVALAHEPGRISDPANELLDSLINRLPPNDRPRFRTYCHQLLALPASSAHVSQSAATLPIESCPLLAMRFLPTDFRLDLHQANTADSYSDTTPCHDPHTEPFSQPASQSISQSVSQPLLLCLPLSSQRLLPQTEHSGGPLGDPSARVFEVFLIVSQSVGRVI